MENKLFNIFKKSKNNSRKLIKYFDVYEENLSKFKGKDVTFVEIGVHNGGSLDIWKEYFGPGSLIVGIDVNPDCKKFEKDNVKIYIGNQSDPLFWKDFFKNIKKLDIVLDDGGHTNLDQIITMVECVPKINDGGLLITEDTCTSYLKKYNSSEKFSFINFCKKIIDDVNNNIKIDLKKNFKFSLNKYIYSTFFYESIVVFNIDRTKTFQNEFILNDGEDHKIENLTWEANNEILKDFKNYTKTKIIKNFLRIFKKIIINKKIKKFFN